MQAVVDVGAHLTSIVIHHHGVPRLVRTVARGGEELTEQLAERLNLTLEVAERRKRDVGLTGDDEVADALRAAVRPLLAEIRSSINYFRSGNDNARLERISLTGGGAALSGLAVALTGQVGVPVDVVSPMTHIGNRKSTGADVPESEAAATAVAVGLAMGAAA